MDLISDSEYAVSLENTFLPEVSDVSTPSSLSNLRKRYRSAENEEEEPRIAPSQLEVAAVIFVYRQSSNNRSPNMDYALDIIPGRTFHRCLMHLYDDVTVEQVLNSIERTHYSVIADEPEHPALTSYVYSRGRVIDDDSYTISMFGVDVNVFVDRYTDPFGDRAPFGVSVYLTSEYLWILLPFCKTILSEIYGEMHSFVQSREDDGIAECHVYSRRVMRLRR